VNTESSGKKLKELLENGNCFKLVCGAGNGDVSEIERLTKLYYAAGCRFFDLSASENIVKAAKRAAPQGCFCVSVSAKGDPHCRTRDLEEILPPLIDLGIDCIELHASGTDEEEVMSKWLWLNKNFNGFLSVCAGRGRLSDVKLTERIKKMTALREPYTTIVQADGFPMSGGEDDYKTTLQAVAAAQIIQNANLPVYLMLSGGTNSKTAGLAKQCGINYHGIAMGSFARAHAEDAKGLVNSI
jgi:hypothetical protein